MASAIVLTCLIFVASLSIITADSHDRLEDRCRSSSSCSSCLSHGFCSWCVIKSRCSRTCGNDSVIHSRNVNALLSGPQFCPRIVEPKKDVTFKSGEKQSIVLSITQVYVNMAFNPWKCKINVNGKESFVPAALLVDKVYCETLELVNELETPYAEGNVTVFWDHNKHFDGALSFKVCRCDIEPNCIACKK